MRSLMRRSGVCLSRRSRSSRWLRVNVNRFSRIVTLHRSVASRKHTRSRVALQPPDGTFQFPSSISSLYGSLCGARSAAKIWGQDRLCGHPRALPSSNDGRRHGRDTGLPGGGVAQDLSGTAQCGHPGQNQIGYAEVEPCRLVQ